MNNSAVWLCANPSPIRSDPWMLHWIPQGGAFRNNGKHAFLTCRRWNATTGISVQNADLTNSSET